MRLGNSVWYWGLVATIGVIGFSVSYCGDATSPERYYWAICEAPGYGYLHEGPFDTRQAAVDRAWEVEQLYRSMGIYMDCEIEEQAVAPF